jgi:hypothetical protein
MPIEESAGMLIMAAAYARAVGASTAAPFLNQWKTLWTQWADYLTTQVPTPAKQITTDDWAPDYTPITAGVNLAIKAIIGLEAAGQIATIIGDSADASTWSNLATSSVAEWVTLSTDSSGTHLNVEQGVHGTWTSLYNAYYELVIGSSLVPTSVASKEAAYYLTELTTYGMPLQSAAANLNKVAWQFYLPAWLKSYSIADELMTRNVAYINATPSLVPYGDRYNTSTGVEVAGIQAHPTLGAVFAILAAQGTAPGAPTQALGAPTDTSATEAQASAAPTAQTASVQQAKSATKPKAKKPKKPVRKATERKPRKAVLGRRAARRVTRRIARTIKAISASFSW